MAPELVGVCSVCRSRRIGEKCADMNDEIWAKIPLQDGEVASWTYCPTCLEEVRAQIRKDFKATEESSPEPQTAMSAA